MGLKNYFEDKEYECRCGVCGMGREMTTLDFQTRVNFLRHKCGFPMTMTCAVRCFVHNKEVGGARYSRHLPQMNAHKEPIKHTVEAGDFQVATKQQLSIAVIEAIKLGFTGIGVYSDELVIHLDLRLEPMVWTKW